MRFHDHVYEEVRKGAGGEDPTKKQTTDAMPYA